jgi:hypothetical protein
VTLSETIQEPEVLEGEKARGKFAEEFRRNFRSFQAN